MGAIAVIGDEATCAGFRLTGVDTFVPRDADVGGVLTSLLDRAEMVVLTRRCAAHVDPATLHAAVARERPLVVVVPEVTDPDAELDLARRMQAILGIES